MPLADDLRPGRRGLDVAIVPVNAALVAEWGALARTAEAVHYLRPGWVLAWQGAFAPGRTLSAMVARDRGDLVAVLPLLGLGTRVLRAPTNAESPQLPAVGVDPEVATAMLDAAGAVGRRWSLAFVPHGHPLAEAVRMAPGSSRRPTTAWRTQRTTPWLPTDHGTFSAYEAERFSASRRRKWQRNARRLEELGGVEYVFSDGSGDLESLLEEGFAVEASGWKGEQRTAVTSDPATRRFYWDIARWAAEEGTLRLGFLRSRGRAVAFTFAIQSSDTLAIHKTGYDENLRANSPGFLLLREQLRRAFDEPSVARAEFLGEAEDYKLLFTDLVEVQDQVEVFAGDVRGRVERKLVEGAWRARDTLAQRVPLEVRERMDLSSPRAVAASSLLLAQSLLRKDAVRSRSSGR